MTAKTGFLAESSRQPRIDFSKPLSEQFPITWKDARPAAYWIGGIVAAVVFGLYLAKVL